MTYITEVKFVFSEIIQAKLKSVHHELQKSSSENLFAIINKTKQ